MPEQIVENLVKKFLRGECTSDEKEELARWIAQSHNDPALKVILENAWKDFNPLDKMPGDKAAGILSNILNREDLVETEEIPVIRFNILRKLAVAAIFIIVAGAGTYFLVANSQKQEVAAVVKSPAKINNDAAPGKKKAELTLADGSVLSLDTVFSGTLARQGNMQVVSKHGEVSYDETGAGNSAVLYNKMSTGRGESYPLILSDGSKVWLNAASSLRYPVTFGGDERLVELTGEAYFEVAKNPAKPFKVTLNGMEIRVLGTHFNVNGYSDESIVKTTLLEGSVRVTKGSSSVLLVPGQQANLKINGKIDLVKDVDTDEAVSWKDGYFHFSGANLETVMRQLSRWYDVDIQYEGKVPVQYFDGDIEKNLNLSQVLKVLERSQVHAKIEGSKLIVIDK